MPQGRGNRKDFLSKLGGGAGAEGEGGGKRRKEGARKEIAW